VVRRGMTLSQNYLFLGRRQSERMQWLTALASALWSEKACNSASCPFGKISF